MNSTNEASASVGLSPELFQKIKAIQIRTQRLVTDVLAGEYESAYKGRGMEFDQVREYQAGDDVRHIDWNVTARMSSPFVKEYREERELTVMLLVDVSSSGAFGTRGGFKNEVAAEIAAVLAYTAIHSNDRVGLIVFSDEVELFIPPKKGRAHVWRVIREILEFRPSGQGTDIQAAIEYMGRVVRRRAVGFVISDFFDSGYQERLAVAARRHDLTAVTLRDVRETELPPIGLLEVEDAESGEVILIDASRKGVAAHREAQAMEAAVLSETLRSAGIGELRIRTDKPYIDELITYFRDHRSVKRKRRRLAG